MTPLALEDNSASISRAKDVPQMSGLDRVIAAFSPAWAWKRLAYRRALASAGYEGGRASRLRKHTRDNRSPDDIVADGGRKVRAYARHLERNHDVARGAMRVMVRNIVGANGITVEPMPRRADGKVHNEFADQISRLVKAWSRAPEVTRTRDWPMTQRAVCAAWLRDGEQFTQQLIGPVAHLQHATPVPFSLELLEADFVPLDWDDLSRNIRQGIQCNAWGAATNYFVYKRNPLEGFSFATEADLKQIPAWRMLHPALRDRLHQRRGISMFAAVVNALEDIKEIADYEMAAAKLAASLTAVITRNGADDVPGPTSEAAGPRPFMKIEAGMVFDATLPGESVEIVDSKRPNSGIGPFIDWRTRGVAAGIDGSYSSISRNYNGTYSSKRQELVEVWESYRALRGEFVGYFVRPVYEQIISVSLASGLLKLPSDIDPYTVFDGDYRGPAMPWIQPVQEAEAELINVRAGFKSLAQVVRERGSDPWEVMDQRIEEVRYANLHNLVLDTDPAKTSNAGVTQARPDGSRFVDAETGED